MDINDAEKLGIACRFEGIAAVKALLRNGVKFDETSEPLYNKDHEVSLLNVSAQVAHGAYHLTLVELGKEFTKDGKKYALLPTSERIEIYRLLKENAKKCNFHSGRLFYYALLSNDTEMLSVMREKGEALPDCLKDILTNGGRNTEWSEFCYIFEGMDAEEFFAVVDNISSELGGRKINFSEILFCCVAPIIKTPKGLEFILERFDQQKMKKGWLMKRFIDENKVGLLEVTARHGWLKTPKKRDEMIKYASDNGKTEALAFLLEFKNRTSDPVKEQAAAEKRMLRELNANPYSVTELKKSWNFAKNGDGTVAVTSYKGNRTEVKVPEKIGKDSVTEIGCAAFTSAVGFVRNVRHALLEFRRTITSIALPESIEIIGDNAFAYCEKLSDINIPSNVRSIGERTFLACRRLENIVIPNSVTDIGESAFTACVVLRSARLPCGLTEIRKAVFSQCWALEDIIIPESVMKIGTSSFHSCKALKRVELPPALTEIGYGAFSDCIELEEIVFPKSVISIEANAFGECPKLTATVDKGSFAEKYCKENQIKFKYKEN